MDFENGLRFGFGFLFSVYGIETNNLCLSGNIEELVTEFKARYPNLKGCSLRSVKRFCNHQGMRKRMPVSDEVLNCRSR